MSYYFCNFLMNLMQLQRLCQFVILQVNRYKSDCGIVFFLIKKVKNDIANLKEMPDVVFLKNNLIPRAKNVKSSY